MSHNIILDEGDTVTEGAIRTILGRSAMSGYVEKDTLGITYHDDDTVNVDPGEVHILHNRQDITIETDAFTGHDLVANSENTLWIVVDHDAPTEDEAVSLSSNATGVAPPNPSIEIATVDTNKSPQDNTAVDPSNRGTAAALEGEDLNPRSIGEGQRVLQVLAELVDAESIVGGGAEFDAVDAQAGSFGSVSSGSVATDQLNGTHYLDPDRDDFGQALLEVLDIAAEGDVIKVPNTEYRGPHTPVEINTPYLTIRSERHTGRDGWRYAEPRVVDVDGMEGPFIIGLEDIAIANLTFAKSSDIADGAGAIRAHKPCFVDGVVGQNMNGPVVHLRNDGSTGGTDNVNNSRIQNVSGNGGSSDVVKSSKSGSATRNLNGLRVHVLTAKDCDGWAINFGNSFGNVGKVDHVAGGLGGIRFGGVKAYGEIVYAGDGVDHAVQFDDQENTAGLIHANASEELAVYNDPNNSHRWLRYTNGANYTSPGASYRFDSDVRLSRGKGMILESADENLFRARITNGGEWLIQEA